MKGFYSTATYQGVKSTFLLHQGFFPSQRNPLIILIIMFLFENTEHKIQYSAVFGESEKKLIKKNEQRIKNQISDCHGKNLDKEYENSKYKIR